MQNEEIRMMEPMQPDALPAVPENSESAVIGAMLREMLSPIISAMAGMVKNNTEALERVATAQKLMSDRMDALEKQVRLNTPVTQAQVRYINSAIKQHARELLDKRGYADDTEAVKKLTGVIRKAVLGRYGIGKVSEIPKHEYPVAMQQISTWNDMLAVRDIVRAAQKKTEAQNEAE